MSKRLLRAFSWIGQLIAPLALGVLGYPFVAALTLLLAYYLVHRMIYPRPTPKPQIGWFIGLLVVVVPGAIVYGLGAGFRAVVF